MAEPLNDSAPLSIEVLDRFIARHIAGKRPPATTLHRYRKHLAALDHGVKLDHTTIDALQDAWVFVEDRPRYFFHKVSAALQAKGRKTVLLTRWGVGGTEAGFYDHVLLYDSFAELKLLRECDRTSFFVQAWVGWNFLPAYIHLITNGTVYCNINDFSRLVVEAPAKAELFGLTESEAAMDFRCEQYIMNHVNKVTMPYIKSGLKVYTTDDYRLNNLITFPSYPSLRYMADNKRTLGEQVHLLFVGGIPPDALPDATFRDAKMHTILPDLLRGTQTVTFYINPAAANVSRRPLHELYPFFTKVAAENTRFTFQNGYMPWDLARHSHQFSFGLMVYSLDGVQINGMHFSHILPSKLFTYLELGLPVIVVDGLQAVRDFVIDNGVGIVVSEDEIGKLPEIIEQNRTNYQTYVQNIRDYCITHHMGKMVDTMIDQDASWREAT